MRTIEERLQHAHTAKGEELWKLIRDPHPQVVLNATLNRNLSGEMALFIAKKSGTPAKALGFLAGDIRFKDSIPLKLALCRNPKTPQRVTFSLLKFLRIFDLGDLTRDRTVPVTVRQKIELLITERIPSLPSGVIIALSRRASAHIVVSLMERGDAHVISACLDSPLITEAHLFTVINKPTVSPTVIQVIAEHRKWSRQYLIKYALLRNQQTPLVHVARLIPDMKTADLRELYAYENLSISSKPHIFSELRIRGETVEMPIEEIFEVSEDDDLQDAVEGVG